MYRSFSYKLVICLTNDMMINDTHKKYFGCDCRRFQWQPLVGMLVILRSIMKDSSLAVHGIEN